VEVEEIGKLMVDELPPGLPAGTPVEVAFDVNLGGDLKVTASVSGRSVVANIVRDEAAPSMEQPASGGECSVLATRIPIKTTEI
jgi:predicted component of type VI protein secretion system